MHDTATHYWAAKSCWDEHVPDFLTKYDTTDTTRYNPTEWIHDIKIGIPRQIGENLKLKIENWKLKAYIPYQYVRITVVMTMNDELLHIYDFIQVLTP